MIDVSRADITLPLVLDRQSIDAMTVELRLEVQSELMWFEGHFPNAPILPGVVQINWVRTLAATIWVDHATWLTRVNQLEAVKFQQVIRPADVVFLSINIQPGRQRIQFKYFSGEKVFASGRLVLTQ